MLHRFVGAAIAAAVLAGAQTQQPPPAPQQARPTFKARADYIEVDATVTDRSGRPVSDLTKDEFTILEGGVPRPVTAMSYVDVPVDIRAKHDTSAAREVTPDAATNDRLDGRVFMIALDDREISQSRTGRAREAAEEFLDRYVGPNDLVGVVGSGVRRRNTQALSPDKALARRAIEEISGHRSDSSTSAGEADAIQIQSDANVAAGSRAAPSAFINQNERYQDGAASLETLANMAEYLGRIRGRRKALVWISEGVNYLIDDPNDPLAASLRVLRAKAIDMANRGNVTVYGIDPRGMDSMGGFIASAAPGSAGSLAGETRVSQEALQVVSSQTGGFATINFNVYDKAFERILRDNSSYYVLGYYPDTSVPSGKPRTIEVKVSRPGVTVRGHRQYVAEDDKPGKAAVDRGTSPELADALASPLPVTGIPLRLTAASFKGSGAATSVALTIELDASKLPFSDAAGTHDDALELAIFAVNRDGTLAAGAHDRVDLKLGANYETVREQGIRLQRRLDVPPGRYRMLAGIREANTGITGTVFQDLDVPDFSSDGLALSGIVLTSQSASAIPTARPDLTFKGVLPAPATALRTFPRTDTLTVFTELYDARKKAPDAVVVNTRVTSESGADVFSAGEECEAGASAARCIVNIPLAQLAPGRYVLSVTASTSKHGAPDAERSIVFSVR